MDTLLPSVAGNSSGSPAATAASSASRSAAAAASGQDAGDTVTFSAEARAKAAALASNAGAGIDARGQSFGAAKETKAEDSQEANALLQALKSRVDKLKEEISSIEERGLPAKEREAKLSSLRSDLVEAQTAYYKAKTQAQGGKARGGSRAEGFASSLT
ncbi:hypothetical protein [Solidesulfovibrio sp.]